MGALPPPSVMSGVQSYVNHQVLLLTQDGRVIVGVLEGYDSNGTIVMSSCVERMFSEDAPVEEVPLGVYIVRGDSIALLGPMDLAKDRAMPLSSMIAAPIPAVRH